jgi:hypothetical protein
MAKIIPLADYRIREALRAGSMIWQLNFKEPFDAGTGLPQLSPETLCRLAEPGNASATIIYALIIGLLEYGESVTFDELGPGAQNTVLDVHLFLSDQIRFEMMYRLGWLDAFGGRRHPLIEMVLDFERVRAHCCAHPPSLSTTHPDYGHYSQLFERDQQVFIRRMLIQALEAFQRSEEM